MKLMETPELVVWPETHYVYVESIGPFLNTAPQTWKNLHQLVPAISEHNKITGYLSLYKVGPKIYRAGVSVASEPKNLPQGVSSTRFEGGKYNRFVLTDSYSNLPEASRRVFQIVSDRQLPV